MNSDISKEMVIEPKKIARIKLYKLTSEDLDMPSGVPLEGQISLSNRVMRRVYRHEIYHDTEGVVVKKNYPEYTPIGLKLLQEQVKSNIIAGEINQLQASNFKYRTSHNQQEIDLINPIPKMHNLTLTPSPPTAERTTQTRQSARQENTACDEIITTFMTPNTNLIIPSIDFHEFQPAEKIAQLAIQRCVNEMSTEDEELCNRLMQDRQYEKELRLQIEQRLFSNSTQ